MSSTIDSKPDLQPSQNGKMKPRFSVSQLFPAVVRETFVGPNKAGWTTTGLYIAGAALCLGITAGFAWLNQPAAIAEYGKVGQKFFGEFVDPTLATSLKVSTFDTKNVEPREFEVAQSDNGQWVIPSHHNYPADAEEQLANTAASVIGVERGAMVTRWPADHAKYGVVDPQQDTLSVDQVDGVGQRLTLRGEGNSLLADFIVGKQVEGEFGQYYVRHPEEDEVYITSLDVDLSTKFTDWIDTDLFDLNISDVRRITINDYAFDELNGSLTQSEVSELTRNDSGNDWTLASLNEESEELNKDAIRDTLNEIAGLEITGVRPKQEGLTPDLKLDRQALKSQAGVERLQADLLSSGFLLQPSDDGDKDQLKLIAREGELLASTKDGLVYRLHFGRAFAGSQEELEIGFVSTEVPKKTESADESTEGTTSDDPADPESEAGDDTEIADNGKPGRYVFVRVDFDKTLLGDEPAQPVEPTKSSRLVELEEMAKVDSESTDEGADDTSSEDDTNETGDSADASENLQSDSETNSDALEEVGEDTAQTSDASSVPNVSDDEKESEKSELEKLQAEFDAARSTYETDLKAFEDYRSRIESGQQKAKELNRRFAKWYYVISGESYDALALKRHSFVSAKTSEPESSEAVEPVTGSSPEGDSTEAEEQGASISNSELNFNETESNPVPVGDPTNSTEGEAKSHGDKTEVLNGTNDSSGGG